MAAKQQHVTVVADDNGDYHWVREAKNSAILARSHRTWDTPGLAVKNALAVNRPPFQLVTPKETREVLE